MDLSKFIESVEAFRDGLNNTIQQLADSACDELISEIKSIYEKASEEAQSVAIAKIQMLADALKKQGGLSNERRSH